MNKLDDFEELAWLCLGYAPDTVAEIISEQCDPEEELGWDLNAALEKKFGCDFSHFCDLVEVLLPMTPLAVSPITGEVFHAFIDPDGSAVIKIKEG